MFCVDALMANQMVQRTILQDYPQTFQIAALEVPMARYISQCVIKWQRIDKYGYIFSSFSISPRLHLFVNLFSLSPGLPRLPWNSGHCYQSLAKIGGDDEIATSTNILCVTTHKKDF